MNRQNETIKINIEIDDRDLRNLQDIISDLNNTLADMNTSVGNVANALGDLQPSNGIIGGVIGALGLMAGAFAILSTDTQALQGSVVHLTRNAFPNFSKQIDNAENNLGSLISKFRETSKSAGGVTTALANKKGAVGLLGISLKLLPLAAVAGGIWLLINAIRNSSHPLQELNDKLEENRQAHQNAISEIDKNEHASGILINTLLRLNAGTEDLNHERAEAARIVSVLNAEENNLSLSYDEQTNRLTENSVALLEQERDRIAMNATLERSGQHLESLEKAIIAEYNANAENRDQLEGLKRVRESLSDQIQYLTKNGEQHEGQIDGLTFALEFQNRAYYNLKATLGEFNDDVEYHYQNWIAEQQAFEARRQALIAEHGLSYELLSNQQRDVVHRMVDQWQIYTDKGQTMFRQLATSSEMNLSDMADNMDYNIRATENWQRNLSIITQRYGAEVAEHFRNKGESGMAVTAMMASEVLDNYELMSDGTLRCLGHLGAATQLQGQRIADNLIRAGEVASNGLSLNIGDGADEVLGIVEELATRTPETLQQAFHAANFPNIGKSIPDGLIEGMGGLLPELIAQSELMAEEVGFGFKGPLGIFSPSRVFRGYGENIIQGLDEGLKRLQKRPINILETVVRDMQRAYNSSERDFQGIGRGIMTGLNQGLINGEPQVMATARRIADNISRTMQQALQINSPSRVMREQIGRQIPAGVAVGIEKYSDYAIDSVEQVICVVINLLYQPLERKSFSYKHQTFNSTKYKISY